jgi:hypothetical protein
LFFILSILNLEIIKSCNGNQLQALTISGLATIKNGNIIHTSKPPAWPPSISGVSAYDYINHILWWKSNSYIIGTYLNNTGNLDDFVIDTKNLVTAYSIQFDSVTNQLIVACEDNSIGFIIDGIYYDFGYIKTNIPGRITTASSFDSSTRCVWFQWETSDWSNQENPTTYGWISLNIKTKTYSKFRRTRGPNYEMFSSNIFAPNQIIGYNNNSDLVLVTIPKRKPMNTRIIHSYPNYIFYLTGIVFSDNIVSFLNIYENQVILQEISNSNLTATPICDFGVFCIYFLF